MEKPRRSLSQASPTAGADKKIRPEVPFDLYAFPFENVVFEGGSGNLLAYVGAVRVSYTRTRRSSDHFQRESGLAGLLVDFHSLLL